MTYRDPKDNLEACRRYRQAHPLRLLLKSAKDRARIHGMEFSLTEENFGPPPTHCPVLGLELVYPGAGTGRRPESASLDRLDNSRGYVPGNVAIISWRANKLKSDATVQELKALIAYMERQR